jgi:hypothetical protein
MFVYRIFIFPEGKSIHRPRPFSIEFQHLILKKLFEKYLYKIGFQFQEIKIKYLIGAIQNSKNLKNHHKGFFFRQSSDSGIILNQSKSRRRRKGKIRSSSDKGPLRSINQTESFSWYEKYKISEVILSWYSGKVTLNISVPFKIPTLTDLKLFVKFQTKGFPYQISVFESENNTPSLSETRYHDVDYLPLDCLEGKAIIVVIIDPMLKKVYPFGWMRKLKEIWMVELYTNALKTYFFKIKQKTMIYNFISSFFPNPFRIFNFYTLFGITIICLMGFFLV